jgi:hypothetical protein
MLVATTKNVSFSANEERTFFHLAHVMCNLQLWDLEELLNTPQENNHEENEAIQAESDDDDDDEMDIDDIVPPKLSGKPINF